MPIIPWEQVVRGSDTDTFCCEEHSSGRYVSPLVGYRTVNCQEFQELITPAVDHRLTRDEMQAFERHAELCPGCRREFEMELATKALVRSKVKMVKTPPAVIAAIDEQIRRQPGALPRTTSPSQHRSVLSPLAKALGAFLLTAVAIVFLLSQKPSEPAVTADDPASDVIAQSFTNYHAVLKGDITPQMVSDRPEQLQSFFSGKTSFAVQVPSVRQYALVGGVLNDFSGVKLAHLVYRNDEDILYVYQADWNMVRNGTPLNLPVHVKNELINTGWFLDRRPDGDAIVLWTRGTTLCAAVANIDPSDLVSRIAQAEQTADAPH